ncbi:MAG TPA: NADH-quinone oxidoreductase subunit C, partial [Candidatus Udaeobacter sp.]
MESLEQIKARVKAAIPGAKIDIVPNPGPANQPSLLIDNEHAPAIAKFLRDDAALRLDFCSNVTGVDWLDRVVKKTVKVKTVVDGVEKEVDQTTEEKILGYLEAVYHLYSMAHKHGPVIIRMRTADRAEGVRLLSLTPVWRSAEFQERE